MKNAILCLIFLFCLNSFSFAQTTAFTYQGKLTDGGAPGNTNYDFEFRLFAAETGNAPLATESRSNVLVASGVFAVKLDFGAQFTGEPRYLEIAVKPVGAGIFTTLAPRQLITSAPYAFKSLTAATSDVAVNSTQLGGTAANQFVQTTDARLSDARNPLPSSPNYIQNTSAQQPGASFSISGNGTAGGTFSAATVNANTQYNIAGVRIFAANAPYSDGLGNNYAASNTFAGEGAGLNTAPGPIISGRLNTFFGAAAGQANTTGGLNTFFGFGAGFSNTTGNGNAFFGQSAGQNTTGGENTYLGRLSGLNDYGAGFRNAFVGANADFGGVNTNGLDNTLLGSYSRAAPNLNNQTAIGARASVTQNNSLILGAIQGVNGAAAGTKVGIGVTAPTFKLQVIDELNTGLRVQTNATGGTVASFGGNGAFAIDAPGVFGGRLMILENGNVGIGTIAPDQRLSVLGNASKSAGGGAWAVFSDERLKNINGAYTRGLADLMRLSPIRFEYKPDNALGLKSEGEIIGFSAQEVERVVPEAVSRSANGFLQINNDPILWTMLNAVKEQQTQIQSQQTQIEKQQKTIESQQLQVDALKRLVCELKPEAEICREEHK